MAVDLGGTNCRLLFVEFQRGEVIDVKVKHYEISEELRVGSGAALFDHLANSVCDFLEVNQLKEHKISLGEYTKKKTH